MTRFKRDQAKMCLTDPSMLATSSHFHKDKSKMSRTQFPLVAGFALTVNKAQGLTVKEGVVIHLVGGSRKFKPASKHGLPFVVLPATQLDRSDPPSPYQTTRTAFRLPSPHPH